MGNDCGMKCGCIMVHLVACDVVCIVQYCGMECIVVWCVLCFGMHCDIECVVVVRFGMHWEWHGWWVCGCEYAGWGLCGQTTRYMDVDMDTPCGGDMWIWIMGTLGGDCAGRPPGTQWWGLCHVEAVYWMRLEYLGGYAMWGLCGQTTGYTSDCWHGWLIVDVYVVFTLSEHAVMWMWLRYVSGSWVCIIMGMYECLWMLGAYRYVEFHLCMHVCWLWLKNGRYGMCLYGHMHHLILCVGTCQ